MLLKVAPWGQVNPATLRSGFLRRPAKNISALRTDLWAGGRAERVTTMLNHARRLKDSQDRLRQALSRATPAEIKPIKALLKAPIASGGVRHSGAAPADLAPAVVLPTLARGMVTATATHLAGAEETA